MNGAIFLRYLGNKDSILKEIELLLKQQNLLNSELRFFDAFSGTGSVANHMSSFYEHIIINDNLTWSVVYSKGRLVANECTFEKLKINPFDFFNSNKKVDHGFFYNNYSLGDSERMYFSEFNAGRIDYFRQTIEDWFTSERISTNEYYFLLACLIESLSKIANVAGVYGAFLKHWDPRSLKEIKFEMLNSNTSSNLKLEIHNEKLESIIPYIDCDILYLDPPYTQNQYGTQYHILETLILNDQPQISKITGSRPTGPMRSDWSKNYKSHILFDYILANTKAKHIVFSYNNDGFMTKKFIEASMKRYGEENTYVCKKISYKKYQNWKSQNTTEHFEYLFYVKLKNKKEVRYESPLNYIGNKSKVINAIKENSPRNFSNFIDSFGGGLNVGINYSEKIIYNDINHYVTGLVESFYKNETYDYLMYINKLTKKFNLEKGNKEAYSDLRNHYNSLPINKRDPRMLFTLILYGFNQQIRFNNNHEFNNPAGIRGFNDKILEKLVSFSRIIKLKDISFLSEDYKDLLANINSETFVYLDPPYMLTNGSYNDGKRGFRGWDTNLEKELFIFLNELNKNKVNFMLSYVAAHKGQTNDYLLDWIKKNNYITIELGDIIGISGSKRKEVLIINYDRY